MAIFTSKIHENIKRELEKRRNTIDRSYSDYNFLTRIPFIILESNAVRRGSSDDASKYVLRGLRSNNVRLKDYVMLGKRPIAGITSAAGRYHITATAGIPSNGAETTETIGRTTTGRKLRIPYIEGIRYTAGTGYFAEIDGGCIWIGNRLELTRIYGHCRRWVFTGF